MKVIKGLTLTIITGALVCTGAHFLQKYKQSNRPVSNSFSQEDITNMRKSRIAISNNSTNSLESKISPSNLKKPKKVLDVEGKSISELEELTKKYPNNVEIYEELGILHMGKDYSKAEKNCEKAVSLESGSWEVYSNLGRIRRGEKMNDEAALFLEKAIKLKSDKR